MKDPNDRHDDNEDDTERRDRSVTEDLELTEPQSTTWPGLHDGAADQVSFSTGDAKSSTPDSPVDWPNIEGYIIEQYLGGGGFGDVFKARSIKLGGPVAIKILKPQFSVDETVTKRFQQEVQAAAQTRHTHVVHVLDTDLSTQPPYENCRYLVTEYLSGGDFRDWLNRRSPAETSLDATVRILIGICRGLEAIHRNGIVHRDLKPDNVLLDEEGIPKVGDFGLSAVDSEQEFRLTGSDQIFGTLPYMAPEQILGARNAVPASDQYAVGVMLYVVLCKLRPWQAMPRDEQERSRILSNLQSSPPPPAEKYRRVDDKLQDICLKCLQPLPADRHESVMALRLALESWLHDESTTEPQPRPNSSYLAKYSLVTVLALMCAASIWWSIPPNGGAGKSSDSTRADTAPMDPQRTLASEKFIVSNGDSQVVSEGLTSQYEFDFVADRASSGNGALIINFEIQGRPFRAILGHVSGSFFSDGAQVTQLKETVRFAGVDDPFSDGKRHHVRLSVIGCSALVRIDQQNFLGWTGNLSRVQPPGANNSSQLSVECSAGSRFKVSEANLVQGVVSLDSGVRLPVAAHVEGEYELAFNAKRISPDADAIRIHFPVGESQTSLMIAGYKRTMTAIQTVDNMWGTGNETAIPLDPFSDGQSHRIRLEVRDDGITVWADHKQILSWKGDANRLSFVGPGPGHGGITGVDISLFAYAPLDVTAYAISNIELRSISD